MAAFALFAMVVTNTCQPPWDVSLQPFSAASPWNRPLPKAARFAPAGDPRTADLLRTTPYINAGAYSVPVYQATTSDPKRWLANDADGGRAVLVHLPDAAEPAEGTDANLVVIEPGKRYAHECWVARRQPDGAVHCAYWVRTDLWGSGIATGGPRAFGGSAFGGLIRSWELDRGEIRHALALALPRESLRTGWVWPAVAHDSGAEWSYSGSIRMGTLVAIPPNVNLNLLPLSLAGRAVANALQRYGAYVVDSADSFVLYAEPAEEGSERLRILRAELATITQWLRPVINNSPTLGQPPKKKKSTRRR